MPFCVQICVQFFVLFHSPPTVYEIKCVHLLPRGLTRDEYWQSLPKIFYYIPPLISLIPLVFHFSTRSQKQSSSLLKNITDGYKIYDNRLALIYNNTDHRDIAY